jgi:hypothetical protein
MKCRPTRVFKMIIHFTKYAQIKSLKLFVHLKLLYYYSKNFNTTNDENNSSYERKNLKAITVDV